MTFEEFFEEKGYEVDIIAISYINENGEKIRVPWDIYLLEYSIDNK